MQALVTQGKLNVDLHYTAPAETVHTEMHCNRGTSTVRCWLQPGVNERIHSSVEGLCSSQCVSRAVCFIS